MRVARGSNQTIPGLDAPTAIIFSAATFDSSTQWSAGQPTRLICEDSGVYQITGNVACEIAFGNTATLSLRLNGSAVIGATTQIGSLQGATLNVTTLYSLNLGDYVELVVAGDPAFDVDAVTAYSPRFMMAKVGPAVE